MPGKKLDGLIQEIMTLLEPVRTKGTVVFIVAPPQGENQGEYAIFGNLPAGKNQELVRAIAIDMAMKDLVTKVETLKAEEELKEPGTVVN